MLFLVWPIRIVWDVITLHFNGIGSTTCSFRGFVEKINPIFSAVMLRNVLYWNNYIDYFKIIYFDTQCKKIVDFSSECIGNHFWVCKIIFILFTDVIQTEMFYKCKDFKLSRNDFQLHSSRRPTHEDIIWLYYLGKSLWSFFIQIKKTPMILHDETHVVLLL